MAEVDNSLLFEALTGNPQAMEQVAQATQDTPAQVEPASQENPQESEPNTTLATKEEPAKQPEKPVANAPVPDFNEELVRITGGAVKSLDDLKPLLENANRATTLEKELQEREVKLNEYKSKAEQNPFANEFVQKYNDLAKGGASDEQLQAFTRVNRLDIDKMDAVEAKVLSLQLEHGLTEREAMARVNRTYKLDPDTYSEEEIADAKIDLKVDSKADKDYLKSYKTQVSQSPAAQQEQQAALQQQKLQQHQEKLQPIVSDVIKKASDLFKGVSINGKEGEGAIKHDFVPSPQSLQDLPARIESYVSSRGENLPATEAGRQEVESYVKNLIVLQNYNNWIAEATSQAELRTAAKFHNPTPISRGVDNPDKGTTSKDQQAAQLLHMYN